MDRRSFAVQIGAALGAEVTGVCSTGNVELVRSIGAAHVIDYTSEDFTDGRVHYDVILDNMGAQYLDRNVAALATEGRLVIIGMQGGTLRAATTGRRP